MVDGKTMNALEKGVKDHCVSGNYLYAYLAIKDFEKKNKLFPYETAMYLKNCIHERRVEKYCRRFLRQLTRKCAACEESLKADKDEGVTSAKG